MTSQPDNPVSYGALSQRAVPLPAPSGTPMPVADEELSAGERFGAGLFWFSLVLLLALVALDALRGLLR